MKINNLEAFPAPILFITNGDITAGNKPSLTSVNPKIALLTEKEISHAATRPKNNGVYCYYCWCLKFANNWQSEFQYQARNKRISPGRHAAATSSLVASATSRT